MNSVRKRLMLMLTVLSAAFLAALFWWQAIQARTADGILASSSREKAGAVSRMLDASSENLTSFAADCAGRPDVVRALAASGDSGNHLSLPRTVDTSRFSGLWLVRGDGSVADFISDVRGKASAQIPFSPASLHSMASVPSGRTAFVSTPDGICELAVHSVTDPAEGGKTVGCAVAGRVWDRAYLSNITALTGCGITIVPAGKTHNPFARHGALALKGLPGPDGAVIATLGLTGDTTVAELVHGSQKSTTWLFFGFAAGVLGFLFLGLVRWVSRPLASISAALETQDSAALSDLVRDRSELGNLAAMVRDFFEQKDRLVDEIAERGRAEGELRAAREQLELRVEERTAELVAANEAMRVEVTERLRTVDALKSAESKYRGIVENAIEGIFQTTSDGIVLEANPAFARILGHESVEEMLAAYSGPGMLPYVHAERGEQFKRIIEQLDTVRDFDVQMYRKNGEPAWLSVNARVVRDDNGNVLYYEGTIEDVSDRKRSESEIIRLNASLEDRISRIVALRRVDIAISSSHDLSATMQIFLSEVTEQLGVDAAAVLLCDQATLKLKYAGSKGFRTNALRHTHLSLGAGQAGKAALERRKIHIADLTTHPDSFGESPAFRQEAFVTYFAVPLLAKGQVKGVLEVFHRSQLETNHEWLDFLDALAGQAAIAIDNASLFEGLQRSNEELMLAYDATIEGWSRALDLRDKETEGHSQRVTEMAIRLGRQLGMTDAELIHVRRGALLHDIGKMGIPDQILLKPAALSDEEWTIMRMHPVYAYEMLYPVEFLRPALDIPYCHHEKWDGAGYPRALKGEQIPIAARIFALVDVWDALRSDRPYRKSWTEEQVIEHVKSLSGTHFDPVVVDAFVHMMTDARPGYTDIRLLPKAA